MAYSTCVFVFLGLCYMHSLRCIDQLNTTVKILKIGTPKIITIIVLQVEQLDFTVQYCIQKMQTD